MLVCEGRHGGIEIEYRGRALRWQEIPAPAKPIFQQAAERSTRPSPPRAQPKWVPPAEHPWRQAVRREMQKRASKLAAVGTASGASVATGCPARDAEAGLEAGGRRGATAVGLALRFALSAPPCGLRRAALRARPTTTKSKTKNEKGDIFNEVREGTF